MFYRTIVDQELDNMTSQLVHACVSFSFKFLSIVLALRTNDVVRLQNCIAIMKYKYTFPYTLDIVGIIS